MEDSEIAVYTLIGVFSSIISGFLWGYLVDIVGPKSTLNAVFGFGLLRLHF